MDMYQNEYLKSIETEYEQIDYIAWKHGEYMISAIQAALIPKKVKYPDKPYSIQQKNKNQIPQELQAEIQSRKFEEWANVFNKKFQ